MKPTKCIIEYHFEKKMVKYTSKHEFPQIYAEFDVNEHKNVCLNTLIVRSNGYKQYQLDNVVKNALKRVQKYFINN